MRQKAITVVCPSPRDATSLYRGVGPLANLTRSRDDLKMQFIDNYDWTSASCSDVLFLQRPFQSKHVQMMEVAKLNNRPIWVDYDDDLFNVTPDNPTWEMYSDEHIKSCVAQCLEMADYVTFSTKYLETSMKAEFSKRSKRSFPQSMVIPNAFDDEKYKRQPRIAARSKLMVWRGSPTHVRDILAHSEAIVKCAKKHPDWTWLFIGYMPWMLYDHMPKGKMLWERTKDPIQYMHLIQDLQPDALFCPLWDSRFNKGKSNIAWIEGSFAGAACVVPDWDGWRNPGATTYDPSNFENSLDFIMTQKDELRRELANSSWDYIQQELTLSKVNKLRGVVLKYLLG